MLTVFSIISRQPISDQLDSVWAGIQQRGWVNIEATHSLESLLNTGGSQWFVTNLVKVSSMLFSACHVM
jgi:mediator of RNA polymerase II transcription subunit 24